MIYMLHISDLHFVKNAASYNTAEILRREAKEKVKDIPRGKKLLIVTGDFHNFSDKDYSRAEAFLTHLVKDMGLEMSEDVFVIPGNHDVGNDGILEPLLAKEDAGWKKHKKSDVTMLKNGDTEYIPDRLRVFRAYSDFVRRLGIYDATSDPDAPAASHVRTWNGKKKLNILHLNTALIADGEKTADGKKPEQMADTDTVCNSNIWKYLDTENTPAIAIGHNSYFDLLKKQRTELATAFSLWNIRAYLCGDTHRTEHDPERQIIRLESGHRVGKVVPNLVAARSIADGNDDYSEVGFCWHAWDEETDKETDNVTVEFRKWTPANLAKTVPDGEPGKYSLFCAKPTPPDAPAKDTPSADVSENTPAAETKDSDAELKAYLNDLLIRVRDDHPSFKLMKIDDLDERLFPGIKEKGAKEMARFTIQGSLGGKGKVSPVWEWIEDSWKSMENRNVVIEGEGGIGKTVTLFSVTEQTDGHPKVPALYIPVFDLVEDGKSLTMTAYLQKRIPEKANAIFELAARPWRGPSLLLLLDGFNEIPVANRYEVLQLLKQWRVDHPGAQMIAVSRPLSGINLSQSLGERTLSIQLTSLEKADVQAYVQERFPGRPLPPDHDEIWKYLVNSLFLTLYLKTGILDGKDASGYPLLPKHANGRGGIIWNFLQRELLRHANETWVIRCAMACEYILPRIAYEMVSQFQFTIEKKALYRIIQETSESLLALKPLTPLVLPDHLKKVFEAYEEKRPLQYPKISLPMLVEAVIHETGFLTEYQKAREKGDEKRYAFIHQHFRDCLAGIYLVNQAEMAGDNELPEVWQSVPSHLALPYAAELMDAKTVEKLWIINRNKQQYEKPEYEKNHSTTSALLELQRSQNSVPEPLDFSGMDLRGLSLTRYMGQGGKDLQLFREARLTDKTRLDRATFQNEGHSDPITCMAVLSKGRVVSGSRDCTLRVWDAATGQCLQTLIEHTNWINCVTALPDGRVVSGSRDSTLRVWDATTGKCLQTLTGHKDRVICVAAFPDGRVVSGSWDKTLRVWDTITGKCLQILMGHANTVTCVIVLSDGRVVSGSEDNTLRVWDPATGKCLQILVGHRNLVRCMTVLADGRVVSGSLDNTLRVWNATTGKCLQILVGHKNLVRCVSAFPDGRVVSGSYDHTLRVWNTEIGQCVHILKGHNNWVDCVTVLPDGRVVSGSLDNTLRVWDATTGDCLQILEEHTSPIRRVCVLPDGRVVSGSEDNTLRVWDVDTGTCLQTLKKYLISIEGVAELPDGRVVIGMNDKTFRGWDAATNRRLKTMQELPDGIRRGIESIRRGWVTLPDEREIGRSDNDWDRVTLLDGRETGKDDNATLTVRDKKNWKTIEIIKVTEVDVSRMDFSQAILEGNLPEQLWHNGAEISKADYDLWVKPLHNDEERSKKGNSL